MDVKINWFETIIAYVTGVIIIFLKLLFLGVVFFQFNNIVNSLFCKRTSDFGVVNRLRKTIHQGPDLATSIRYVKMDYIEDHDIVSDMFIKDFKKLVLKSLEKYPVLYINTNNFVNKNILLALQNEGIIELEILAGYKAPQIVEKVQIMNWGSVVRCFWDRKSRERLFRTEVICKYRLERVSA